MPPAAPRYIIVIDQAAQKTMRRLPRDLQERLAKAILVLETDPRPRNARRLEGFEHAWRLRVGDWRIVYEIQDRQLVITIIRVAPRGSVYRDL